MLQINIVMCNVCSDVRFFCTCGCFGGFSKLRWLV